jgi:hypothetical protein
MGDPWWMSVEARTGVFQEAATRAGWSVRLSSDPDAEPWDMRLQQDDLFFTVHCLAAMQSIASDNNGQMFLENARRLAQVTQRTNKRTNKKSPRETQLQALFVIPYVRANEGNDDQVPHLLDEWLANRPFQTAVHAWVGATTPVLRNETGSAFPGIGLLVQPLRGAWATS